jgi:hypothetical protein
MPRNIKNRINRTIILSAVLYGCETWSLTLMEEHTEGVRKRVSRRILGPKRDVVIGGWSKLHYEELHNLYSSRNIFRMIKSRRMIVAGHTERMGEDIGGKATRKETARKTRMYVVG